MREIIMVVPAKSVKGGIRSVVNMYEESEIFRKNKVHTIASYADGSSTKKLFLFIGACFNIIPLLLRRRIKIVHIHTATRSSFYRKSVFVLLSRLLRKKVIMHVHGAEFNVFYDESSPWKRKFIGNILSMSTVICLSNSWKKDIGRMVKPGTDLRVLYNPVLVPKETPKIAHNSLLKILSLGRLGKRKGTYDLISAAAKMKSRNFRMLIAGDGELEQASLYVEKLKLEDKVVLSGWISGKSKEDLLTNCDIYALPSYNEGLPMSILEAMSHGKPIVSTMIAGIPECVVNGKNGFLINPGDVDALARYLDLLISKQDLRKKMSAESYALAKKEFDINEIAKKLNQTYDSLSK